LIKYLRRVHCNDVIGIISKASLDDALNTLREKKEIIAERLIDFSGRRV
jgi:hypothetical protein